MKHTKNIIFIILVLASLSLFSCGTAGKAEKAGKTKAESVIPDKILGCRFGQSKYSVEKRIDDRKLVREKERELLYRDVSFAGSEWDYVTFYFNVNKKLQKVYFQRHHEDEASATKDYQETATLLMMKYTLKMPMADFDTLKTDSGVKNGIVFKSEGRSVMSWMNFGKAESGKYLWYNCLLYEDNKYALENIKKAMKEM